MLKNKILTYKLRSLLKKNKVNHVSTDYREAESIGVIFSTEDLQKHKTIKEFVKKLKNDGKEVEVLAYLPKDGQNFEFLYDFFTMDDITFWGNFTASQVHSFANKPFDYLFYLDLESNPLILNILAMSKAKCRVGKFDVVNNECCEMMIQIPTSQNIKGLVDEMYKYTSILN